MGGSLAPGPQGQEGLWRGSEATHSTGPPDPSCTEGSPAGEEAGSGHLCPQPREGQMVRASRPPEVSGLSSREGDTTCTLSVTPAPTAEMKKPR